ELGRGECAGVVECFDAVGAVVAHAAEDDADGVLCIAGDAFEKQIAAGAMAFYGFSLKNTEAVGAREFEMLLSRGDVGVAGWDGNAVAGFENGQRAVGIEPGGQVGRKAVGDVLDDKQGSGKIRGQVGQKLCQRAWAAGGGDDADHGSGGGRRRGWADRRWK